MIEHLKLVVNEPCHHAEGPQWLSTTGQLMWVDIEEKEVHLYQVDTGEHDVITLPERIGAAVPATDGSIICALSNGIYKWNDKIGLSLLTELEADLPDHRCNDGKVDPAGRLWIGTMPLSGSGWTGSLYSYYSNGDVKKHVGNLGISNGIDWSIDGNIMYFIDSLTRRVDAFDFDIDRGEISNCRTVVEFPESLGNPDGMCTDAQGRLWVAHWGGYAVTCTDPETGEQLHRIELPASQVTSCCFGGDDLSTLFITTSRLGLSAEQLTEQPLAGSIFSIKLEAIGKLNTPFKI